MDKVSDGSIQGFKELLVSEVERACYWRNEKAEEWSEDERNAATAAMLERIASKLEEVPVDDAVLGEIYEIEGRTFAGQPNRSRSADPRGRSRDENHLAFEASCAHRVPLLREPKPTAGRCWRGTRESRRTRRGTEVARPCDRSEADNGGGDRSQLLDQLVYHVL